MRSRTPPTVLYATRGWTELSAMRPYRSTLFLVSLAATLAGVPASAQITLPDVATIEDPRSVPEVADSLFDAMETRASYDTLAVYLGPRPESYAGQWRAARAALVLGVLESDEAEGLAWL